MGAETGVTQSTLQRDITAPEIGAKTMNRSILRAANVARIIELIKASARDCDISEHA